MATKTKRETGAAAVSTASPDAQMGELEKVRSILFGEQIRAYEERVRTIEATFDSKLGALREEVTHRFDAMRESLDAMRASIDERLNEEGVARGEEDAAIRETLGAVSDDLKEAHHSLEERLAASETSVTDAIERQSVALSATLKEEIEALKARLADSHGQLTSEKTDRRQLADLLRQLAAGLADTANGA